MPPTTAVASTEELKTPSARHTVKVKGLHTLVKNMYITAVLNTNDV